MRHSKLLFTAASAALALTVGAGAAHAAVLYDNGAVVNSNGVSLLSAPATTLGATASTTLGFAIADNFSFSGAAWNVSSLDFYAYQTNAVGFTFTTATWSIIAGTNINTGAVVASGTTAVTNGGLVGYRAQDTTPTNTARAIYRINADVTDFSLAAGNYFVTWSLTGTSASGPFVPPVLGSLGTGNALQTSGGAGTPFVALQDAGSLQGYDVPFTINGTTATGAVPEPATWGMMIAGFGMMGAALRTRRRSPKVTFA